MGVLDRLILNDEAWARMAPHIIGDQRTRGSSGRDNRLFVEAVLWIVRTGSPWRDLPEGLGSWNSVFRRFSPWGAKGVWDRMFAVHVRAPFALMQATIKIMLREKIEGAIVNISGVVHGENFYIARLEKATKNDDRVAPTL